METLKQLYYYPIVIVAASTVGGIGLETFIAFMADHSVIVVCIAAAGELLELSYFCAMGTIIEMSVSKVCPSTFISPIIRNLLACSVRSLLQRIIVH